MYMNNKSTFKTERNESVDILQIAKNLQFLLWARERKEHILQKKIVKFINNPALQTYQPPDATIYTSTHITIRPNIDKSSIRQFIKCQIYAANFLKRKHEEKAKAKAKGLSLCCIFG